MRKDVFEKVPEFLAAFDNIVVDGFFESLKVSAEAADGYPVYCLIQGSGRIPKNQKYAALGCGTLVDPTTVIEAVRKFSKDRRPKQCNVKLESSDWPLYDKDEDTVIGSRGTAIEFSIHLQFI